MSSERDDSSSVRRSRSRSRSRSRDRPSRRSDSGLTHIVRRAADSDRHRIRLPDLREPLASYHHFLSLNHATGAKAELLEKAYAKYKADWEGEQNRVFLQEFSVGRAKQRHEWFIEKYSPEASKALEIHRVSCVRRNSARFLEEFLAGKFASLNLRRSDFTLLGTVSMDREDDQTVIGTHTSEVHLYSQVDITKEPFFGFDSDANTLFIKAVPSHVSKLDILRIAAEMPGFLDLTMSEPVRKLGYHRYCWLEFASESAANNARLVLSGTVVKQESLVVDKSQSKTRRVRVFRNYPVSRTGKDCEAARKLIVRLDQECGLEGNPLASPELPRDSAHFDLCLLYLRRVHAYDYFASQQFDSERSLCLKLGLAFLRVEADYHELPGVTTVFSLMEQSALARAENGSGKPDAAELLLDIVQKFIRSLDKDKDPAKEEWKCEYCPKLFQTCKFLAKHMLLKHADEKEIRHAKDHQVLEEAYKRDPHRLTMSVFRDDRVRRHHSFSRRRDYRDLDEPEAAPSSSKSAAPLLNFLDI